MRKEKNLVSLSQQLSSVPYAHGMIHWTTIQIQKNLYTFGNMTNKRQERFLENLSISLFTLPENDLALPLTILWLARRRTPLTPIREALVQAGAASQKICVVKAFLFVQDIPSCILRLTDIKKVEPKYRENHILKIHTFFSMIKQTKLMEPIIPKIFDVLEDTVQTTKQQFTWSCTANKYLDAIVSDVHTIRTYTPVSIT